MCLCVCVCTVHPELPDVHPPFRFIRRRPVPPRQLQKLLLVALGAALCITSQAEHAQVVGAGRDDDALPATAAARQGRGCVCCSPMVLAHNELFAVASATRCTLCATRGKARLCKAHSAYVMAEREERARGALAVAPSRGASSHGQSMPCQPAGAPVTAARVRLTRRRAPSSSPHSCC